ncbi:hypotehtical YgfJ [Shewanella halifaxensis HAW-EB4]|uniref:Hypotehtical YgfJ n=1 Tax=Shewanella halifaxensis (strain HAW-EB4) TaxID=458817 RepID=B0TS87_SHEHH|nr:NTP transferase domain-containing protein [Shewanella halifaxensis]ABZ75222.1 hypotehtical YgfJ [Shewanella halifaxensis HAW-EB4]
MPLQETQPPAVDCVIPAAGLSSRMGDWKLMLAYKNHTILDQCIENALSFCSRVILVAGFRGEELMLRYRDKPNILVVINEHFSTGMFSSIQLGVQQVSTEHFFITHGDMPMIDSRVFHAMWQRRGKVVFPGNPERTGHPVLLPRSIVPLVVGAAKESKMKSIIKQQRIEYLALTTVNIHLDVDTPEAYQALLKSDQSV